MAEKRICQIPGCSNVLYGVGKCKTHYTRLKKYGSLEPIQAPNGAPWQFIQTALAFKGQDCLIWPFAQDRGYGAIVVLGVRRVASRLVCEMAHGAPPKPHYHAAHSCNNRACVNPAHLRWATPKENSNDKNDHGTMLRGESHPNSKLTKKQIDEVISLMGKKTRGSIALQYGVSVQTVHNIFKSKRGLSRDRIFVFKTHCPHGHFYSDANTRITKLGHRKCLECDRARDRKRYRAKISATK